MVEIELKYAIGDKRVAEDLWNDAYIAGIEEKGSRETLLMKSVYFDTDDGALAAGDIAFRVRQEGSRTVASLKWNGSVDGAFHMREEINVPIDGEACLIHPDPTIFKESDVGAKLIELMAGRGLVNIMEVCFFRKSVRVDTGDSIIEISIDAGEVTADSGAEPILELELELFSGAREDLLALGEKLAAQYDLTPESRSKYARGLLLFRGTLRNS